MYHLTEAARVTLILNVNFIVFLA